METLGICVLTIKSLVCLTAQVPRKLQRVTTKLYTSGLGKYEAIILIGLVYCVAKDAKYFSRMVILFSVDEITLIE